MFHIITWIYLVYKSLKFQVLDWLKNTKDIQKNAIIKNLDIFLKTHHTNFPHKKGLVFLQEVVRQPNTGSLVEGAPLRPCDLLYPPPFLSSRMCLQTLLVPPPLQLGHQFFWSHPYIFLLSEETQRSATPYPIRGDAFSNSKDF